MRNFTVAASLLVSLAAVAPAWGQGESPPRIVDVEFFVARFTGDRPDIFEWTRFGPRPGTPIESFNPQTDLAYELDYIYVVLLVVDDDLEVEEGEEVDVEFYYRVRAYGSSGPPEAGPLRGTTAKYVSIPWEPVQPPPENAVLMYFALMVPEISGPNQDRLRGRIDYDVFWLVEVCVANEEDPELGQSSCLFFYLDARKNPIFTPSNPPPFANAGPDQLVAAGSTVVLDGSESFDSSNVGFDPESPDVFYKDTLAYAWEWISGPERVDPEFRDDGNPATAQVTLTLTGDYMYRLLVEDGVNPLPSTDTVTIRVVTSLPENRGPRAIITAPTAPVILGTNVRLSADHSSDPDGDPLTYRWRQTNAVGGALQSDEVLEGFQPLLGVTEKVASWRPIKTGTYYFSLLVTDPSGLSDTAFASVQVIEMVTAGQYVLRPPNLGTREPTTSDVAEPARSPAPFGCGGGGLLPLAAVPVWLWFGRGRSR